MRDVEVGIVLGQKLIDLDPGQPSAICEQWFGKGSVIEAVAYAVRGASCRHISS